MLKFGDHPLDPEVADIVPAAARHFEELGCHVEEAAPDLGGVDGRKTFGVHWLCFAQHLLKMYPADRHNDFDPSLLVMAREGQKFSSADLVAAMADRRMLSIGWTKFFDKYDLLLC